MTRCPEAWTFARAWEAGWNSRDVEAILTHFHDDALFTSPVAKQVGFADDGVVKGKDALRRYWHAALQQNPNLRFEVTAVYRGTDTIVIAFRNQNGVDRAEVLTFKNSLVIEGHGTFAVR